MGDCKGKLRYCKVTLRQILFNTRARVLGIQICADNVCNVLLLWTGGQGREARGGAYGGAGDAYERT